jgi:hypothetical protein
MSFRNNLFNLRKSLYRLKLRFLIPDAYPILKVGRHKFIFIHINKTGGTSISRALGNKGIRHQTVREIIEIVGKSRFENSMVFTCVRNPWDKVVSHYEYRVQTNQTQLAEKPIPFNDWVKLTYGVDKDKFYYDKPKMFMQQTEWLKNENGSIQGIEILRFENLEADFHAFAKKHEIETKLEHIKATKRRSYMEYYNEETKEIVRNWFADDVATFGYQF